ncbi:glycosyltransferase family 39 protein [Parasulfuritortus cantonensis]|nr:glycosyltransferase family 39 protein [Parasulfuritortus cantonensis]
MHAIPTSPARGGQDLWLGLGALAYFAVNALSQCLVSPTAELDQAQQLVLSQDLSWGYGPQPPLYSWLVNLLFALTGPSLAVLYAVKVALLGLLVAGMLQAAREIGLDARARLLAVAGLALIPQFVWESQRDLTHSVLATVCAVWTLWALFRLYRAPSLANHVLLGVLVGLGVLSKYNFGFFVLALIGAALLTPAYRRRLLTPRLLLAVAVALLVLAPHLAWFAGHAGAATASSAKFKMAGGFAPAGAVSVLYAVLAFLGPLILAYALSWRRAGGRPAALDGAHTGLLVRLALVMLGLLMAFVLVTGATHVKDRWMQPLFFFVPLLAAMTVAHARVFLGLAGAIALAVAVLLPGQALWASLHDKASRRNLPYAELAAALRAEAGRPDVILASNELLAGNMRLAFPDSRVGVVWSPDGLRAALAEYRGRTVWFLADNGGHDRGDRAWTEYAVAFPGRQPQVVERPLLHMATAGHRIYWLALP